MATRALPPWLDIAPRQFTEAAISGAQLGQRGASESGALAQRTAEAAAEIANKAAALQVQREEISARLAAQQAAANQRAQEAQMQNAIAEREMQLQEQLRADTTSQLAQKDAAWQEGMSRYQRAVNAGDEPAAADLEILTPLRESGFGTGASKSKASKPPAWSGPMNMGDGNLIQVNRQTGQSRPVDTGIVKPAQQPKMTPKEAVIFRSEVASATRRVEQARKSFSDARKSQKPAAQAELTEAQAELEKLTGGKEEAATPALSAPASPPRGFIGTPGGGNAFQLPPASGMMIPPMPGAVPTTNLPASKYKVRRLVN